MAKNRSLYPELQPPRPAPSTPKPMPFEATRPHQYWSIDIRYLDMHRLGDGNVYCFTILDNYSRAVVASTITRSQDLTMYLFVLFAAIRNHGAPEAIVTDGGSVFRAKQALHVYTTLGITKRQIDPKQPWQSYVETMFNVQRRMADTDFAAATTWEALVDAHAVWVANYNYQDHWAHRFRRDERHSPVEVLGWIRGRAFEEADLRYVFYATRFQRYLNRVGYLRFRNWRIYAEEGLASQAVVVWLYSEHLTIVYEDLTLAQYHVSYQADERHFTQIKAPHFYATTYQSRQLSLWDRHTGWWQHAYRVPVVPIRRIRSTRSYEQLVLDPTLLPDADPT